jgi:hypothetical protein
MCDPGVVTVVVDELGWDRMGQDEVQNILSTSTLANLLEWK